MLPLWSQNAFATLVKTRGLAVPMPRTDRRSDDDRSRNGAGGGLVLPMVGEKEIPKEGDDCCCCCYSEAFEDPWLILTWKRGWERWALAQSMC